MDGAAEGVHTAIDTVGGVVHIRYAGAAPELAVEPRGEIGKLGGLNTEASPEEFGDIRGVIADGAGRIYVADGHALEIRVFGPDGRFLRRLGREGAGPGEIGGIHDIAWLGEDTLVVLDYHNARLMRLSTDGEHLGQWRWLQLTGSVRFLYNGGPREIYVHTRGTRPGSDGPSEAFWVRYTPEGPQDSLPMDLAVRFPASATCRGGGGIGFFTNPHAARPFVMPAPHGERLVANTSKYRLAFVNGAGDTTRVVSRDVQPVALTDAEWAPTDSAYARFRDSWSRFDCEGTIERPAVQPVLRDVSFDHHGRMLVEYETPEGPRADLYGRDWRWLGTVELPERDRSEPPFLRRNRLYLVLEDSLGVERVAAYRLRGLDPLADG